MASQQNSEQEIASTVAPLNLNDTSLTSSTLTNSREPEKEKDTVQITTTNPVTDHKTEEVEAIVPPSSEFEDNSKVPKLSYWQIFILFLDFGIHAWGGPVAQIALIKEKLVTKQGWITHARFNRVFAVYQVLPGPEATELSMFFGYLSGGRIGGILAGLGFILPGFLLVLLFSYIYVLIGLKNQYFNASLRALQPIVAALVLRAVHKLGEHAFISHKTKKFDHWLFSLAILSAIQSAVRINFFITLGVFGLAFMFIDRKLRWLGVLVIITEWIGYGIYVGFKGFPSPESLGVGVAKTSDPGHVFALGLIAGSLSFGGAYTTVPFLQAEAVTIGKWISKQTFLDAIAIGNVLPSPLVMFSTFLGFQGGYKYGGYGYAFLEATLITIGIFLPCFVFTIMGQPVLEKLVRNKFLSAFFDGITGSVVGIVAITALSLLKGSVAGAIIVQGSDAASQDSIAAVLYVLTLAALYSFNFKMMPLILVLFGAIGGQFLFIN